MNSKMLYIFVVTIWLSAGIALGALVVGELQMNDDITDPPSPITAYTNDLLETSVTNVVGENPTALVRDSLTDSAEKVWGSNSVLYELDISTNVMGYNISEIRLFSGWTDWRAKQYYNIQYSLVGSASFSYLGTQVEQNINWAAVMTRTYDDGGADILSGVDAIKFLFTNYNGSVYREFDVIGVPVPLAAATIFSLK